MPRLFSSLLLSLLIGASAQAVTLTFENITTGTCCAPIPNGYGGLNWQDFLLINGRDYKRNTNPSPSGNYNGGYNNGRVSGEFVAFNNFGLQARFPGVRSISPASTSPRRGMTV